MSEKDAEQFAQTLLVGGIVIATVLGYTSPMLALVLFAGLLVLNTQEYDTDE